MKENMTCDEIMFFVAYILYIVVGTINQTELMSIIPMSGILVLLKIGAVVIVCLKIILDKEYTGKQIIAFWIIVPIIFISCIYSKKFELFYFVCFVFGIKDISYLKVLRVTFIVHMIVIAIVMVGVGTGIISNETLGSVVWSETMISDEFAERNTLGFVHPNTASAVVFFTTMIYMCMRNKCSFIELLITFGINFMVYQKTGSRTCFLITIIFLPFMYYFFNKKKFERCWKVFFTIASVIIILTATLMQVFYEPKNEILVEIDSLLSSRLRLGHQGLLDYGITLLGQETLWISDFNNEYGLPYNYVDSAYMRVLLENGIVIFILLCIVIVFTMYYLTKIENKKLCVAFLALLVHSMVEMSIYNIALSPFCLLMGHMVLIDDKKSASNKDFNIKI